MKKFLLIVLVLALLIPAIAQAQISKPSIPRTWWDALETFIRGIGEQPVVITAPGKILTTTSNDTLALFVPNYAMSIEQINLNFSYISDPDSTAYLLMRTGTAGIYDTLITIDSTGNGYTKYWSTSTSFNLVADTLYTFYIQNVLTGLTTGAKSVILHGRIR